MFPSALNGRNDGRRRPRACLARPPESTFISLCVCARLLQVWVLLVLTNLFCHFRAGLRAYRGPPWPLCDSWRCKLRHQDALIKGGTKDDSTGQTFLCNITLSGLPCTESRLICAARQSVVSSPRTCVLNRGSTQMWVSV